MVDRSKHASLAMRLHWQSRDASHCECQFFERVNFWRDVFPDKLAGHLPAELQLSGLGVNAEERVFSGRLFAMWAHKQTVA